jgi:hypothetical protein
MGDVVPAPVVSRHRGCVGDGVPIQVGDRRGRHIGDAVPVRVLSPNGGYVGATGGCKVVARSGRDSGGMGTGVVCRVLGELAFEIDGVGVPLGGSLSRRLVAGLATGEGFATSDELLAEYVWGDERPAAPVQALRVMSETSRRMVEAFATRDPDHATKTSFEANFSRRFAAETPGLFEN